jgi:hypothetical protein
LIRFRGAIALIQSGDEIIPHACIEGKATQPVEEQGKASSQVGYHQFQHVDVQASRENVLEAAMAIVPASAGCPEGKEPKDRQPPISSKKPITPALHGQHRQQQGDQGDADTRTGKQHACIDHQTSLDQPGLSVPSGLLRPKGGPERAD